MKAVEMLAAATKVFLSEKFQFEAKEDQVQIDHTRKEFEGDFTLVVFPFSRVMKMSPDQCAEAIGEYLLSNVEFVKSFNVIKGFLNISLSSQHWAAGALNAYQDDSWLKPTKANDLILVEYSSPNTNKPLHLGHMRNIFLGNAVSMMRAFDGHQVVKTQIINDRGVHICKSMFAWKMHAKGESPESSGMKGDKLVGKYYVMFDEHLRAQMAKLINNGLDEESARKQAMLTGKVQEMLLLWENQDPETLALWKMMNGWVYEGFEQTYQRMRVDFDKVYYESETYIKGKQIIIDAVEKGVEGFYRKDDGSIWVNLQADGLDDKLIIRGDGTTVYMTQDIGTAVQRYEDFPELKQVVYTVGDEQDYHFKVLFKVLEKLGFAWAKACKHLSYGMVDLPSGRMKSREGTVVDADDLMDEVVNACKTASAEKGKLDELSEADRNELFEILGIGALKFYLLRVDPKKRMLFNPEESVALNGDTGPFVQYTHARCRAVLRKAGDFVPAIPTELDERERALIKWLLEFRTAMHLASADLNPAAVASYALDLAKLYNQFYQELNILKSEGVEKQFRLTLTKLTADTIKCAMALIGIRVPEQM